ncbi:MAG: HAMP domain-containing histidine kinase [Saccharofermentans sp.]|nr:HAMP domain-containing histidine kinase [Saccharofermentans sp.]
MRKKITDRISFKVFLITFVVQVVFGLLICLLLYNATPSSWNRVKHEEMDNKFQAFLRELDKAEYEQSGSLIDDFIVKNGCDIALYEGGGPGVGEYPVIVPGSNLALYTGWQVQERTQDADPEKMVFTASGIVKFTDKYKSYTVMCFWTQEGENVLMAALRDSMPLIIVMIVLISLICSFIYTYLFARPVRKLSELSGRIADMDFSAGSGSKRRDEIGDLGRDLDKLAHNLDETITSLNKRTEDLEKEIERVNELERQKDVFFAAASHELKTPITIAQGQVRGMIDGIEPYNDLDTYLPRTLSALKRMESLINEILTVSRMQAENEIAQMKVDLTSLLNSRTDEIKDLLEVREIPLVTDIDKGLYCEGNTELISMAVGAFLSNAVYYSNEGSEIVVKAHEKDGMIVTEIRNTNSHIDEEDLPHLFEAFYRSDSSRNRRSGGSGLGLYLGKIIVERHNGNVSLDNDGQDVAAVIELPIST